LSTVVVELRRANLVENLYRGDIAVVDAQGRLLFSTGDSGKVTYWRSAAKPIQALPLLTSGAADAFGFTDSELSIMAASHSGEPIHVQTVAGALRRAGLMPNLLQCGVHAPTDQESAQALQAAGQEPTVLHNNCSGKHAGMLALATYLGLPLHDYLAFDSELQQLILKSVAEVVGLPVQAIQLGVDGCGVPVFGMPLLNMAVAFARLAHPEAASGQSAIGLRRMRDAMIRFPYHVAGRHRICTELMTLGHGRFVAKSGAEGVYCVGVLAEAVATSSVLRSAQVTGGIGIAVKAENGDSTTRHMMIVEALRQLDLLTPSDQDSLSHYGPSQIKNHAGRVVGELKPVMQLVTAVGGV